MHDNQEPDTAPVLGERMRRLVGWHGYDWMKAAVAVVLAALLLYGNATGENNGEAVATAPTDSAPAAAMAVSTDAPPTEVLATAATAIQNHAPTATTVMIMSGGATMPTITPTANAESTEATASTAEGTTEPTSASTAALPTTEATTLITSTNVSAEQPPADVIVVTDVSGSMAANNKIASVRTALASFADILGANNRIELISFSDTATVTLSMQPVSDARASVKRIARGLTPGGSTTLYDTTLLAFKEMQANGDPTHNRVIIVLTDGRDERLNANDESIPGSTATLDEALAGIQRGGQSGIRLFTIGYGANADNDVLQRMAAAANGKHFAAGPSTIQDVYQTIAQSL